MPKCVMSDDDGVVSGVESGIIVMVVVVSVILHLLRRVSCLAARSVSL